MIPEVSVVTALYNSSAYLPRYFQMLDAQTFRDFDVVLIDDGSTDQTCEIVQEQVRSDSRYRLIQKKPEGYPSRSRALGLNMARSDLVAFCDHDDFWAPQKLELQMSIMKQIPNISVLHTDRIVWKSMGAPNSFFKFTGDASAAPITIQKPEDVIYKGLQILFSSFLGRKSQIQQIGFHPDMKGVDDFYLFVRLAGLGQICRIDLPLTYYSVHQGNLSYADNIFVKGFYQVAQCLASDPVSDQAKRAVLAQAYRTEGVSVTAENPARALTLFRKSLQTYFIPSTLTRLIYAALIGLLPHGLRRRNLAVVKRLKFVAPTLKDLLPWRWGR